MEDKDLLKKYKSRLKVESLIKSLVYGLIIGLMVIILLSLILYLFKTKNLVLVIIIGIISSIISTYVIYSFKFKPSVNNVAKRIDELGLEERIITMVEFSNSDKYINVKQREDAKEKLSNIEVKALKLRLSKMSFIILGLALILTGFTMALPDRSVDSSSSNPVSNSTNSNLSTSSSISSSSSSSSSEVLDEDEIIQKMLDELRNIIDNANIDQDVKDELHAIVDELETSLEQKETLQEKIEAIEETQQEIKDRIEYELLRISLGRALQQYEMTKELGIAIYQEDLDKVDTAISNLIFLLSTSSNVEEDTRQLIDYLNQALAIADKEENEALIEAVRNFADSLLEIISNSETASFMPDKLMANDGDNTNEIIDAIEAAGEEIKDALRKSEETQEPEQGEQNPDDPQEGEQTEEDVKDVGDQMDSAMEDAKNDLQEIIDQNKDPNEDQSGNQSGGENNSDNPTTPPPTFDDSPIESEMVIDGKTPYLDVYDEYSEYIKAYLAGEDIPDEIRELVERYLEMIKE